MNRKMFSNLINLILILSIAVSGCSSKKNYRDNSAITGYNLSSPDMTIVLPDTLREVSGITVIDDNLLACIQDENGILFIYDIDENKIVHQYSFHLDGDYEGITKVGETIYILRSDGTLFEIINYSQPDFSLTKIVTGIQANNNEGLCYNKSKNRLLIACKSKIGKGPEYKDRRFIYSFDLETMLLSSEPVFDFDVNDLKQFAADNKIDLPKKSKQKDKNKESVLKFRPSAICIHPVTGKLFLLSASDHMLFIFDMDGNIEYMELLNPKIFNKAEGISFFENGDMIITNEAQEFKPTILRFNYTKAE